ncbi:hypothetical protein JQ599_10875 [Bradyrhizobium diazoefficiens]|nr:hypothetical protein [Bradyrhizobium diazoefficiens]MBR0700401.1 hypothetical protein [Bradyrhizobium diazoefficiens]MBR0768826.1 hypothetical protein [Bradyrhizobium diazoefficiens]
MMAACPVMSRIALLCMFALAGSPTLAGEGPADRETDQLMQILCDEIAREDCLWRESLTRLSDQTLDEQQKISGLVAYFCSQKNREQIIQGATTEDLVRHEVAQYDQLWAHDRAIAIGRQIRQLRARGVP